MMAEKKPHERWRLMGKVVKAMNRFKASLNPDVDFKGNVAIKHAQVRSLVLAHAAQRQALQMSINLCMLKPNAFSASQNHGSDEAPQLSRGYGSLQRYSSGGSPTLASEVRCSPWVHELASCFAVQRRSAFCHLSLANLSSYESKRLPNER